MRFDRGRALGAVAGVSILLAGCGVSPDSDSPVVAYREADSVESLEVPPDLTRPRSGDAVDVPGEDGSRASESPLLPEFRDLRFVRAGAASWLEVADARPDDVWPRVDGFLRSQGLTVQRREPQVGIIETAWARRYDAPPQGGIGGFINSFFSGITSSDIRDKYLIRLERMDAGGTRIFLAHRSAEEVSTNPNTRVAGDYAWARGDGDPAIEAEMTRRLLVYLGLTQERAGDVVADAQDPIPGVEPRYILDEGAARLMVDDADYRRVFARVGDALGRIGARVESAEIERGVYALSWIPPEDVDTGGGFLGLFGDDEPDPVELQLQLSPRGNAVRIKAADAEGTPRSGAVQRALLREVAVAMGASREAVQDAEEADTGTVESGGPEPPGQ